MPVNMKIYPPWWNADITLYNRDMANDGTVAWYATRLSDCYYSNPRFAQVSGRISDNAKQDADSFICRIRESENYRRPAEWALFDEAGKQAFFTLYTEDIIVLGHIADVIDESTAGQRSSDLLAKYAPSGAFRVAGALECIGNMVGSPHYKATGVA